MDSAFDVPDSTDWLNTPLAALADLENALHCQICKEFYDTPMITSCSHTFCSRCIRTSLSADGRCPACRASDQASKLRNNWQLQEVVSTFTAARPQAIKIAREEQDQANNANKSIKRKRATLDSDDIAEAEQGGRTTRSKSRRTGGAQSSQVEAIEVEDPDDDDNLEPGKPQDDGLVECPLGCGKRMKIEAVEPHLDRCEDEKEAAKRAKSRTPIGGLSSSRASPRNTPRPQDRISELNYSLLKEGPMRKKMDELGLPSFGNKQLMVRRHTEWVNLWNANCDSSRARTKRELLSDLDTWERTQGGRAPTSNHGHGIMRKDFDGNGWAHKHNDDFSRLIADARRKKTTTTAPEPDEKSTDEEPIQEKPEKVEESTQTAGPPSQAPSYAMPNGQSNGGRPLPWATAGLILPPMETSNPPQIHQPPAPASPIPTLPPAQVENIAPPEQSDQNRKGSHDYHLNEQDGKEAPCELPSHLATSAVKHGPMFSLPQEYSRDVNTGHEDAKS